MREHVCIRKHEWVAGTRERPGVRVITQTAKCKRPTPRDSNGIHETVRMTWRNGPVVARRGVLAGVDDPLMVVWRRNRGATLVGFRIDKHEKLIAEAWVPMVEVEAA